MHSDSISPSQRRYAGRKRSTFDESLSFSTSETSGHTSRKHYEHSVIFPSRFDYVFVIIGLQTGVTQLMFIFIQVEKYGGIIIFLTIFLMTIFITLPLMVHQLFSGFYNKCGFIKLWNMAPIGFGIGLTKAMYSFCECVVWAAVAGLLILHVCHVPFRSISAWTACKKIVRPEEVMCYDAKSKLAATSCQFTRYPALEFYKEISYNPQLNGNGYISINGGWFVCCFVVWLIVFVMVSQGFRRLKHILIKIPMLCLLSLTLLVVFSIGSQKTVSNKRKEIIFHIRESPTRYTMVWLVWHAVRMVQISQGTLTTLGSYTPTGSPLFVDSLMILLFACIYNFAFAYFAHCCHAWVEMDFVAVNHRCLAQDPMTALFASVPTAISFLAMGNLWLFVFYTSFALKTIIQIVITLTATINAMSEMFHLHRHRQQIVAVLCTAALLLNLPLTMINSEMFFVRTYLFVELIVDLITIGCSVMAVFCFYSASRAFDDVHFINNSEPIEFHKLISYLATILMFFIIILGFTSVVSTWAEDPVFHINTWAAPFVGFTVSLLLAPIPIVALYMYVVHLMKHNISAILKPTESWGPQDPDVKRARLNFNPRSELRYRSKKPCTHHCLLDNLRMKIEVEKRDFQRKEFFLNIFHNPNYAEWEDDEDWHYGGDIIGKARAIDWAEDFGTVVSTVMVQEEQKKMEYEEQTDDQRWAEHVDDAEESLGSEGGLEADVKDRTPNPDVKETLTLDKDTEVKTEADFEPDVILPNFNSLQPRSKNPDTHTVADQPLTLPQYTVDQPTYVRRRRSRRNRPAPETPIEPPSNNPPLSRRLRPRVSRSKSSQTEKGLRRLKNLVRVILPWKKRNRKKHRCSVGTNPGCSRRPTISSCSSKGSETLSEIDEWP